MPWVVKHDASIDRRTASFPEQAADVPSGFVRIVAAGESAVLKCATRRGASGTEVRLQPSLLARVPDGSACELSPVPIGAYQRYWLTRDPARRRALLGLTIAVVGVLLKLALELGKTYPILVVGDIGVAMTNAAAALLTIAGLIVTFLGVYASTE